MRGTYPPMASEFRRLLGGITESRTNAGGFKRDCLQGESRNFCGLAGVGPDEDVAKSQWVPKRIRFAKGHDPFADNDEKEKEIDRLGYSLYALTEDEAEVVEDTT